MQSTPAYTKYTVYDGYQSTIRDFLRVFYGKNCSFGEHLWLDWKKWENYLVAHYSILCNFILFYFLIFNLIYKKL